LPPSIKVEQPIEPLREAGPLYVNTETRPWLPRPGQPRLNASRPPLRTMFEQADTIMAPAADMFEMGVKVQVLKRGTMFAMRAAKLYEIYRTRAGLNDIPAAERANLEKTVFRATLEEVWAQTYAYFQQRDASQIERAARDPKHQMALVFRWYLGQCRPAKSVSRLVGRQKGGEEKGRVGPGIAPRASQQPRKNCPRKEASLVRFWGQQFPLRP